MDRAALIEELTAEGLYVMEWTEKPGAVYPEHSHPYREVRVILDGSLQLGDEMFGPGDRIDLEPGAVHTMTVGEGGATYLAGTARLGPGGP